MNFVRCSYCGLIYHLGYVEITGRYADCMVWTTPCCHRTVDDRGGFNQDPYTNVTIRGDGIAVRPGASWEEQFMAGVSQFAWGHTPMEIRQKQEASRAGS